MSGELEQERPVTNTVELAEAFGLGKALAEIHTTLGHVQKTVDKTDGTVSGLAVDLAEVKLTQARQGEQIKTLFERTDQLEKRPEALPAPAPEIDRREFDELKSEVKAGRLSWGKIGLLLAGIGAFLAISAWIDAITPQIP